MISNLVLVLIIFFICLAILILAINIRGKEKWIRIEHYQSLVPTVVLLKTHTWSDLLEKFAIKVKNETLAEGIDFYILLHCEHPELFNKIKNKDLKQHVLIFKEDDIKKLYAKGFYGMWLSNHWILMWFYKKFKNKYQYYWSIEYDVRISGDSSKLWTYGGTEDFVYPIEPFQDPNWRWKNHYVGGEMTDNDKYYGYLQLARYSGRFLDYLDKHFEKGENGQDEMIIFSLFKRSKYSGSKELLNKIIKDSWTVFNTDSPKHKNLLEKHEMQSLRIYHPIK